jgi:hypothetical protein
MNRCPSACAQKLYSITKDTLEANFLVKKNNMSILENLVLIKRLEKIECKKKINIYII